MLIANHRLFIVQDYEIFIYSLKDYSLIKKFGRHGEGPSEFAGRPHLFIGDNILTANIFFRSYFFTLDGEFKGQYTVQAFDHRFLHVADMLVGTAEDKKRDCYVNLYKRDGKIYKKHKELFKYKGPFPRTGSYNPIVIPTTYYLDGKNIYANDSAGKIHVFDLTGKKLKTITPDIKPIRFTGADKKRYLDYLQNGGKTEKMYYAMKRKLFKFPDYFPPYQRFLMSDSKIYLITEKRIGDTYECIILNNSGKFIRKIPIPFVYGKYKLNSGVSTIKADSVYQLVETDECWDLHITPF